MLDLLANDQFIKGIVNLTHELHGLSWKISAFALTIYIIVLITRAYSNGKENFIQHFFRMIFILFVFSTYDIWTVWIGQIIVSVANSIYPFGSNAFQIHANTFAKSETWSFTLNVYDAILGSAQWLIEKVVTYMATGLIFLSVTIFTTVQFFLQSFLWVFGPLAIIFSLFPLYKDTLSIWFKNFIAVNLWSVFFAAFLKLYSIVISLFASGDHLNLNISDTANLKTTALVVSGFEQLVMYAATSLISSVAIALIPMITSKIIPDSGIGSVGSIFSGVAQLAGGYGMLKGGAQGLVKGKNALTKSRSNLKPNLNTIGNLANAGTNVGKAESVTKSATVASNKLDPIKSASNSQFTSNPGLRNPVQKTSDFMNSASASSNNPYFTTNSSDSFIPTTKQHEIPNSNFKQTKSNNQSIGDAYREGKESIMKKYNSPAATNDHSTTITQSNTETQQSIPPRPLKKRPTPTSFKNKIVKKGKMS